MADRGGEYDMTKRITIEIGPGGKGHQTFPQDSAGELDDEHGDPTYSVADDGGDWDTEEDLDDACRDCQIEQAHAAIADATPEQLDAAMRSLFGPPDEEQP